MGDLRRMKGIPREVPVVTHACCPEMLEFILDEKLFEIKSTRLYTIQFYDFTCEYIISYCPFCGRKMREWL